MATSYLLTNMWHFPLKNCSGIPVDHPGAFAYHRRKNYHTGVDLYTHNGANVHAVEDGIVVHVGQFTGPAMGHTWWNDTWGLMVEGESGVVNYGEIYEPNFKLGDKIERGKVIANVKQVLFSDRLRLDIPGHSCSMLHFELYKHGCRDFAHWHNGQENTDLKDPTELLRAAEFAPQNILIWSNPEGKTVG